MSIDVAEPKTTIEISSFMNYIYSQPQELKIQEDFLMFQNHYSMQNHMQALDISKGIILFQNLTKENLHQLEETISPYLFEKCSTDLLENFYDDFQRDKYLYSDRLQEFIDAQIQMRNNIRNFIENLDIKCGGHYYKKIQTLYVPTISTNTVFNVDEKEHNFTQYVRSYVGNIFETPMTHKGHKNLDCFCNPLKIEDFNTNKRILHELNRYIFKWENKNLQPLD